ncbi:unnamed protein product [Closterium sp. NIES-64]|nr:unnamed protein product [Closterium sp. NIES-65]CAI5987424.1 unnamed protein product [Closterium sp. NIES-65]CAI5989824.1 unnamed protein product [Closterium sp. NIES-64]CAI6001198.1 unnamed protein product [Closterium sp. NIES-64]
MACSVLSSQVAVSGLAAPCASPVDSKDAVSCPSVSFRNSAFCQGSISRAAFRATSAKVSVRAVSASARSVVVANLTGENPDWNDDDFVTVGLAHCFVKDENAKLQDMFVIEAIPAGALECMDNGGVTCYTHVTGTTLGVVLKQDASLLPAEFSNGVFAEDFDFRTKCASRTWKRQHPQEHLLNLVPLGTVRSDFNFSVEDKRVLNMENVVDDSDNIKQDLSIDVYGRAKEENEEKEIEKLYNV